MDLEKFVIPAFDDEKAYRYLYAKKKFVPGKSLIYYSSPYWDEEEIEAMLKAVCYGKWLSAGENVRKFEVRFSKKFGYKQSLMVNSGSSANLVMIAALKKVFNWKDGDEIIVSSVGFPTTLNPIIQNGLKPVFVDISFDDLNWNLDEVEKKITERTVALFSSPVLGNPYDVDRVLLICKKFGLKLIADGCDSLGSKWNGRLLGDYAVATSCSFYASHHLCCGEGGMVSSNNPEIIEKARQFATWGRACYCIGSSNLLPKGTCGNRFDKWLDGYNDIVDHKYIFGEQGYNLKPLDIQGAIGVVQLEKFEEILEKRIKNKEIIGSYFEEIDGVRTIKEKNNANTSWFGVPIVCKDAGQKKRLVKHLEDNKIQTRNYFAGNILLHPAYKHLDNYKNYSEANRVLELVFFIGCSPCYGEEELCYIRDIVRDFS